MPADSPRASHWDFMLEQGGRLLTWALPVEPHANLSIEADRLADHRAEYLTYEGPVSRNRGHVTQWDAGDFEFIAQGEFEVYVELRGRQLHGSAVLSRAADDDQRWMFLFKNR